MYFLILIHMEKMDSHQVRGLISYLYALYDSMAIDMSLQFDLMPVTVKRDEQMYGHKNNSEI